MGLSPLLMTELFKFSENSDCNFRTVHFGSDIIGFIGAKF